jgi:DNA polymerase V
MISNSSTQSSTLTIHQVSVATTVKIPMAASSISAGFPSPADDFLDTSIDLNKICIKNPATTFFGRVTGNSMKDAGIHHGDLMIIDKSIRPKNGSIAVCYIDGEFTVKTIKLEQDCCWLIPANPTYKAMKITKDNDFIIWGIVTHVIKSF